MQYPSELRIAAEENAARFEHKELIRAAEELSGRYKEEKGDGSRLVTKAAGAAAYAVVRMPATFAAVSSALGHTLKRFRQEIYTAADIGAGTGTASIAAAFMLEEIRDIDCFEREPEMRALGEKMMSAAEISFARWHDADISSCVLSCRYDMTVASYALNELVPSDRDRAVKYMWEHTDKLLLMIEPGTKTGYANILRARDILSAAGAHIAAPCPMQGECPLPQDDWCHFTARAERSKLHKLLKGGDVPYEDEKFSFIAAVREECEPCGRRVLRHPVTESGMITLHVCTRDGIKDIKVTRKSPDFKAARKVSCGDEL